MRMILILPMFSPQFSIHINKSTLENLQVKQFLFTLYYEKTFFLKLMLTK